MRIKPEDWTEVAKYIFLDKKLSSDNDGEIYFKSRYNLLVKFLTDNDLEFNRASFISFIQSKKEQGCKNSYINNIIKVGKYIHEYLMIQYSYDSGLADFSYFKRERHLYEIPSDEEMKSIVELDYPYIRQNKQKNQTFKCIFLCLAVLGLRIGELLNLKWTDYNGVGVVIRAPKNDQERFVPLSSRLKEMIDLLPHGGEYIFAGGVDGKMSKSGIDDDLKKRIKYLGIKKRVWLHLFRHYAAVTYLRQFDYTIVAKLLGHENMSSILVYSSYLVDDRIEMVNSHPLNNPMQNFSFLTKLLRNYISKIFKREYHDISISETEEEITIQIKKKK